MQTPKKKVLSVREITLYSMLGTLIFCTQVALEALPNIHLTGVFVILYTIVFRKKALIPIYLYVLLIGVRWGFGIAWIPYVYLWLLLWGAAMLVPKKMPKKAAIPLYCTIGFLHGILFGVLYAPAQAILFGLSFRQTLLWIASGFVFDVVHGISNLVLCTMIYPMTLVLEKLKKQARID
jgi:energy-coupling factor transport system substrate-specific component